MKGKPCNLTLAMALHLLRAAVPRAQLSLEDARDLVAYHLDRYRRATASHRKTWLAEHLKGPRK